MSDFTSFKNKWAGKRVDYDHVYFYQCVDLILQYIYEVYGIGNGVWGNAIDYARNTGPALLTKFDKFTNTTDVKEGDIVVLNGLSGNPYGHIMIGTGDQNAKQFEGLEQNGATGNGSGTGGDAIRTRYVDKSRIAAVLRPKTVSAKPASAGDIRVGKTVFLHAVPQWSVYRVGQQPIRKDRIGYLIPQNYNHGPSNKQGLTYRIEGVSQYPNTVTIRTDTYGLVDIYLDEDAEIL